MNSQWKSFLESQGANLDPQSGLVSGFAETDVDPAKQTLLADLSHLGIIRAQGEDATGFLQGQTTNDLTKLDEGHAHLNGYCSPKGRLLASFYIVQREGAYYILLPRELMEPTLKRLRMYVLMSKVELEDVSDELVLSGIAGPDAAALLASRNIQVAGEDFAVRDNDGLSTVKLPGDVERYLLLGGIEASQQLWQDLGGKVARGGQPAWRLSDIRAAVPTIYSETVEAFVPQMVNMQALQGVSFKKGCYTGQEVVARMQYLGKLKRRMYRGSVQSEGPIAPGTAIFSADSSSGQGAGKVVDAQPSPQGGYELLAVIEIASAEQGGLRLGDSEGPDIILVELPYSLEQAS